MNTSAGRSVIKWFYAGLVFEYLQLFISFHSYKTESKKKRTVLKRV